MTKNLTITNLGTDVSAVLGIYFTTNNTFATYFTDFTGGGATRTYPGVPSGESGGGRSSHPRARRLAQLHRFDAATRSVVRVPRCGRQDLRARPGAQHADRVDADCDRVCAPARRDHRAVGVQQGLFTFNGRRPARAARGHHSADGRLLERVVAEPRRAGSLGRVRLRRELGSKVGTRSSTGPSRRSGGPGSVGISNRRSPKERATCSRADRGRSRLTSPGGSAEMRNGRPMGGRFRWVSREWLGTESNRRHADFQSAALPTELPSLKPFNLFELFRVSQARRRRRRTLASATCSAADIRSRNERAAAAYTRARDAAADWIHSRWRRLAQCSRAF